MIRTWVRHFCFFVFAGFFLPSVLTAQDATTARVSRYEIAGMWLGLSPRGNVLTNSNTVDFASDLGIDHLQSQFGFRFFVGPWDRGGLFLEFIPYRFSGERNTTRSFRFGGVTYPVNETITAKARLLYLSAGYQYNMIDRQRLDLDLQAGVAYFGLRAEANSPSAGSAEVNRDIPFPLAGLIARYSPGADSGITIRGETRGMTFGSFGWYVDVLGAIGFHLSPRITLEGGYRVIDGAGHHRARGAELNFRGPTITIRFHD
jgi:hypothetical protein